MYKQETSLILKIILMGRSIYSNFMNEANYGEAHTHTKK